MEKHGREMKSWTQFIPRTPALEQVQAHLAKGREKALRGLCSPPGEKGHHLSKNHICAA